VREISMILSVVAFFAVIGLVCYLFAVVWNPFAEKTIGGLSKPQSVVLRHLAQFGVHSTERIQRDTNVLEAELVEMKQQGLIQKIDVQTLSAFASRGDKGWIITDAGRLKLREVGL
jgi:hypothetical protein